MRADRPRYALFDGKTVTPTDDIVALSKRSGSMYYVIARTRIWPFKISVSTVFLGINHQWTDGPDIWFETMIFGGHREEYQRRYATVEQARAGHRRAVCYAARGLPVEILFWLWRLSARCYRLVVER